ncbi:hypothetical protein VM98_30445 [Streptomyces rubellomurinus subsp. indigoferus]|uniref:Uncharacterized protein n=1 Tax=Streptomyces rubellomurinus (strain ATCC 31215) TaxID=359131 RepID=A0A0F2T425_STRR3|nr:hypothetical protein VM98_30445 [Streptomyces rubellomurinus subsp. indigoferus]KJS57933.1 hypothetical protein VM95_36535 [Streptomyces rubellomurinus]
MHLRCLPAPGRGVRGDDQNEYHEAAERAARGLPTPASIAVAYTVALFVLMATATVLIASGRC